MFNVQIEISASPALLDALLKIANAFGRPVAAAPETTEEVKTEKVRKSKSVEKTEKAVEVTAPAVEITTETVDQPATGEKTEKTAKGAVITIEELRAIVRDKAQAGKRENLKAILTEFGADNVTTLKEEQYSEFKTKVEAL